jgi:uncharacterized membrane protein YkoI
MSSPTGNKKLFIPVLLVAVVAAVGSSAILLLLPSVASAQTMTDQQGDNSTITAPEENNTTTDQEDNSTITAPEENNTAQASEQGPEMIVGTIRVNENATADEFPEENLNVTVANATNIAKTQAFNGTVVDAHLAVIQGYLVYNVVLADVPNSTTYTVIVDAGDGNVLFTSPPIPVEKSVIQNAIEESSGEEEEG